MGSTKTFPDIPNPNAEGDWNYYTPKQDPPAGAALSPNPPGLFTPLKIRDLTLHSRITLSPLCQYSADDGHLTAWHMAHLGGIISRGPALSFVEATAVTANGRITPQDAGLWKDSQTARLRYVVSFAHSQGQKIGVQLGHAGRKASTVAPWISGHDASSDAVGGWTDDVWAPSAVAYSDTFADPRELSLEGIAEVKAAFGAAVKRALEAGVDAIMIHSAHGYLLHEFLSPETNRRTDRYGGSFENRIRLTVETCELARSLMPEGMPLFCRISATDWLEDAKGEKSWRVQDSIELAKRLTGIIDVLDVSSGGLAHQQKITTAEPEKYSAGGIAYQAPFAKLIKDAVGDKLLVSTVGGIKTAKPAQECIDNGIDIVSIGRMFQKNPGLCFAFADELGVDVRMPNQIGWAFKGRAPIHPANREAKK